MPLPVNPPSFTEFILLADYQVEPPVFPVLAVAALGWYCASVRRVRRAGRHWPRWKTAAFAAGCIGVAVITGLRIDSYSYAVASVFVLQHLTLSMAVPPLLVVASPGTLLLRSTHHHGVGRAVLTAALVCLRSRFAPLITHHAVTIPLFLLSYYGLYFSPLIDIAGSTVGHLTLQSVFLASGILFVAPILATGPMPGNHSNLSRFFDLFLEMPLHVFFGVFLMMASTPLFDVFSNPPDGWGFNVMADQQLAGGLAWSYGEPVAVFVVLVFAARWRRDESITNWSRERGNGNDADLELDAYNDYLRSLRRGRQPVVVSPPAPSQIPPAQAPRK
jgi:putative membrane protein